MTQEFRDHVERFIDSLNEKPLEIHYQAFDFSKLTDSRTELTKLDYDKSKVSFLNLAMIADMFQVFAAVHSSVEQHSPRDFCIEVPHRLSNTRSVGDALRIFGGYNKPYVLVVSIADRSQSEELFDKVGKIAHVTRMTKEQMEQCMTNHADDIRKHYFGTGDQQETTSRNPIGELVSRMIASKH